MKNHYYFYKDQLRGAYLEAFDKAELYSEVENVDGDVHEEMLMNLLDLLLTAQKEEKPVEKIIGPDLEQFCQSYFSNYTWRSRILTLPKRIYRLMWGIFVLELLFLPFWDAGETLLTATTDLSGYVLGFIGGSVIFLLLNEAIRPFIFQLKKLTAAKYETLSFLLVRSSLLLFFYILFRSVGIMNDFVFGDKDGLEPFRSVYQFHAFL